jgi:glutamyl-tRNA synthetase
MAKEREISDEKIKAYALKNAVEHDGKAVVGSVISGLFAEGLKKEQVKDIIMKVNFVVNEVNNLGLELQQEEFEKLEKNISKRDVREEGELPELPNPAKGKMVMRVAPFPSGPLHIGNTRQLILNDEYIKKYGGHLLLFFDDTIGSEEKQIVPEAYKLIEDGIDWLGLKYKKPIIYKSDRLPEYYKFGEELLKKDRAYVCSCSQETLKKNRESGKECEHRKQKTQENLSLWKEMFKPETKEGAYIVRIKTDMKHPNPAFRDRVLFRISEREHPKVKNKYKVWPTLEVTWALDDHEFKMTHIIRGKELMIETDMQKYIFDIFGWKKPEFIHSGLLTIEGVKLSKSKGQKEVKEGRYIGWHDPRLWSLQSLEKRGIMPEAVRKFIVDLSLNQKEVTVPVDLLYQHNRELLHDKAVQAHFYETNEKSNVKILMPDGKIAAGKSNDLDLKKLKDKSIVHFIGFGYCRYNSKEKVKFWLAHK